MHFGIAIAFLLALLFCWQADAPWQGAANKRIARTLDVERSEVPFATYFNYKELGEEQLKTTDYSQIMLWQSCFLAVFLLGGLVISFRWLWPFLSGKKTNSHSITNNFENKTSRWYWLFFFVILIAALVSRVAKIDRMLYIDDQDSMRSHIHGYWLEKAGQEPEWRGVSWHEALWGNHHGNNPVGVSLLMKSSLSVWRFFSGANETDYSLRAVRLPGILLAGLSIFFCWRLACLLGAPQVGLIACGFLAIHPMHIDHSLQLRAYPLVMLCAILMIYFGWLFLHSGKWRHCVGLAMSSALALWSFTGFIYYALTINLFCGAFLLWKTVRPLDADGQDFKTSFARFLLINFLVAIVFLILCSPWLPQITYFMNHEFSQIPLDKSSYLNFWSKLTTGVFFPVSLHYPDSATAPSVPTLWNYVKSDFFGKNTALTSLVLLMQPLVLLMGICRAAQHSKLFAGLLASAIIASLLALIHQNFTTFIFHYWYIIYSLPATALLFGLGLIKFFDWIKISRFRLLPLTAVALVFVFFYWQTKPGRVGRTETNRDWLVDAPPGKPYIKVKRGKSLWITTKNGSTICHRDYFLSKKSPL